MATASSMIFRALRLTGEKIHGGTLTSSEATDYLSDLNSMLDSWSIERLMCYQILQESFSLTSAFNSYTIGPGAALSSVSRPVKIVDPCFVRDSGNLDSRLQIVDNVAYGMVVQKSTAGSYPSYINYDSAFDSSGFGTINLYPGPTSGLTLFINSWKPLQNFANISTVAALPPGYQRAIEFNLAIELSGGYTSVSPEVAKIAREAKAAVQTLNAPDAMMVLDYGVAGATRAGESILTGG